MILKSVIIVYIIIYKINIYLFRKTIIVYNVVTLIFFFNFIVNKIMCLENVLANNF